MTAPVGPHIDLFEQKMASYLHADNSVTSSGTASFTFILKILGIGKGDYVLSHYDLCRNRKCNFI